MTITYFLNKYRVFIAYHKFTMFIARGVLNVPLVKSFSVRLR